MGAIEIVAAGMAILHHEIAEVDAGIRHPDGAWSLVNDVDQWRSGGSTGNAIGPGS